MAYLPAKLMLFVEGANVEIPFNVELHSEDDPQGDLEEVALSLFPHLPEHSVFAEFIKPTDG